VFVRLLTESLRRGARRRVLAAATVAVGILASTALVEVLLASGDRLAAELGAYGANIEVRAAGGDGTFDAAELTAVRRIFWRNNVVAMAPLVELDAELAGAAAPPLVAPLVGTWFDVAFEDGWSTGLPAVRPTLEIDGRWPADGTREVALGRRLAARLGAAPGGEVAVRLAGREARFAVVGVVASGGGEEERAFAPLAAVHALTGRAAGDAGAVPGGAVTRAEVFALTNPELANRKPVEAMTPEEYDRWYCIAYPSSVAHQIDEALPGAAAAVVPRITTASRDLLGRLRGVVLAVAAVALLGAILGVTAVMTATVLERRLEAGLMLALGAEGWRVAGFFLTEAALLGLAGGLLGGLAGLVLGRPLGQAVFGVAVPWAPVLLPLAAAAGVILAVAGSAPPVLRLFSGRPALQLKRATA
jgi:putative ABC transport system permease protein